MAASYEIDIFQQMEFLESACFFEHFTTAEESLVAIRKAEQAGAQVGPAGNPIEDGLRRGKGKRKTPEAHFRPCAKLADGMGEIGRRDAVIMEKEEEVPSGKLSSPVELPPSASRSVRTADLGSDFQESGMSREVVVTGRRDDENFVSGPDLLLKVAEQGAKLNQRPDGGNDDREGGVKPGLFP